MTTSRFWTYTRAFTKRKIHRITITTLRLFKTKESVSFHPHNKGIHETFLMEDSRHKKLQQVRYSCPPSNENHKNIIQGLNHRDHIDNNKTKIDKLSQKRLMEMVGPSFPSTHLLNSSFPSVFVRAFFER
jgi:hypothetical protein